MRTFMLIGALVCALALSAIAVTTASASMLPGAAKTTITGSGGRATFQVKGGATWICQSFTITGEVVSTSEALLVFDFGNACTTAGLPINSLGDSSGTILMHVEASECPGTPSLLKLKVLPLHLEVPSTKLLLAIEGTALATVEANVKKTTFPLTPTQKEGKNTDEKCGKETLILTASTDGGAFVQSGLDFTNASLTFGAAQEFM
jgi:hypothetical protein